MYINLTKIVFNPFSPIMSLPCGLVRLLKGHDFFFWSINFVLYIKLIYNNVYSNQLFFFLRNLKLSIRDRNCKINIIVIFHFQHQELQLSSRKRISSLMTFSRLDFRQQMSISGNKETIDGSQQTFANIQFPKIQCLRTNRRISSLKLITQSKF